MSDPAERFVQAATDPLADNPELQIAARQELTGAILRAGTTSTGDSLDAAAERLESVNRTPRRGWWRYALYTVTAILSVTVLVKSWSSFVLFREAVQIISAIGGVSTGSASGSGDEWEKRLSKNLTSEQRLLLLGDISRKSKADRFAALWESDPKNPAYYADYVTAYLSDRSSLPPDCLETARKLDPDNGWFAMIAAGEVAKQAIDTTTSAATRKSMSPGGVKIKPIKDPAKLDEVLTLLHEAAGKNRIDSYQLALVKQRIPLLPPRRDSVDQIVPATYMAALPAPNLRARYLADAVAAKAIQLAGNKDAEGFKRLLADWEAFNALHVRAYHGSLVDVMIAKVVTQGPLKALSEAAADLGMPEDAARLKAMDERFEARKTATKARIDPNAEMAMHSGTLAGLTLPVVSKQSIDAPVLTDDDLKPGRLADYALVDRMMSLSGWMILGVAALIAGLYRLRCGLLTKRMSGELVSLLRPADGLMIFGIGILFPVVFQVAITHFTPLGGRDWSLKASVFTVPVAQFSSMVWLMIVLPAVIARWRLSVRGGAVGLSGGRQIFGWIAVACGFLAIPAFGLTFRTATPSEEFMIGAGVLLGVLQVYALVAACRALFSKHPSLLRRATITRALLPAYVVGMAAMMIALLCFHAEERRWISQERLMSVTADAPSMSRFEYEVSQAMTRELQELVKEAP